MKGEIFGLHRKKAHSDAPVFVNFNSEFWIKASDLFPPKMQQLALHIVQ